MKRAARVITLDVLASHLLTAADVYSSQADAMRGRIVDLLDDESKATERTRLSAAANRDEREATECRALAHGLGQSPRLSLDGDRLTVAWTEE